MHQDKKTWVEKILKKPHIIISFLALFLMMGIVGYKNMPRNLFPDSNYPEVAVVIVEPGASAKSLASNVAVPVEEELYSIDEIRRVYSSTIDEVTVISAEFEYSKDIGTAVNDVSSAISKIKSKLPSDIKEPQIIKITVATPPIEVISMSPKTKDMTLEEVGEIAQNKIKHKLLKLKGVANVDIFGGFKRELQIIVDKNKLDSLHLTLSEVIATLQKNDKDFALGFITNQKSRYLLKSQGKRDRVEAIKNINITPSIKIKDIAKVYFGHYENSSEYFGNGKRAIALSVQRATTSDVIKTVNIVEKKIEELKKEYPNISFEVSDTQKDTIELSTNNMFESLRDAIVMSTIVVFLFLASFRQILVVLVTIPLVYASTVALMSLVGLDFNVITLTAIILALGLLLDDTVVVMENIERHYQELREDIQKAVLDGTKEIMFADLSGTVTTMIALAPMLFVGGYPQTIFAPLAGTLLLALVASYVISILVVPLLSLYVLPFEHPFIIKAEEFFNSFISKANDYIQAFFATIVKWIVSHWTKGVVAFAILIALFISSIKIIMPIVGQELTPPMDTGEINIKITMQSNLPISKSAEVLEKINKILKEQGKLLRVSGSIGSEAGVMSIGSGGGIDNLTIKATYIDRHHRKKNIWQISRAIREKIAKIAEVKYFDVTPAGGTAMSSIRGNVDATLSSDNLESLLKAKEAVFKALSNTKGVVSVLTTWDMDKIVYDLDIDEAKAKEYGLNREDITKQVQLALRGALVASFPKSNNIDYGIRVWLKKEQIDQKGKILSMLIDTKKGKIPLSKFATIKINLEPTQITRDGLQYTLDIYGNREKAAISHIMDRFEKNLASVKLPPDVKLEQTGDIKSFKDAGGRMVGAIIVAVGLIFLTLIVMFGNFKISLMILFSIPLTVVGGSWAMLIANYHVSMAAMMGFILLAGIIVNNAILLIHFAIEQIKLGLNKKEAMLKSIKIRTRPVLMTAFAVSVGMLPVAQGSAIGLEKLAPLGAVAIGGLIIGTLMTLVFIPVVFIWTIKEENVRD